MKQVGVNERETSFIHTGCQYSEIGFVFTIGYATNCQDHDICIRVWCILVRFTGLITSKAKDTRVWAIAPAIII